MTNTEGMLLGIIVILVIQTTALMLWREKMTDKVWKGTWKADGTGGWHTKINSLEEAMARIAELEAALKPFADKADKAEGPFEPPYPVDYPLWRAARAALGEKE